MIALLKDALARSLGTVLVGAVALVLTLIGLSRVNGMLGADRDNATTLASRQHVARHPAEVRWRQKLAAVEAQQRAAGRALALRGDSLRAALARGERVDTVLVLQQIATADSAAYQRCSLALSACEQRALSAEHEADSLTQQLTAQLGVKDHRWGVSLCLATGRSPVYAGLCYRVLRLF